MNRVFSVEPNMHGQIRWSFFLLFCEFKKMGRLELRSVGILVTLAYT